MIILLASLALSSATAIEHARIEVGDGHVIETGTVVIDNDSGRIVAVGKKLPPDVTTRIDASGKTLSPGLIETRGHLGLVELSMVDSTVDYRSGGALTPAFRAADGFNADSVLIPVMRAAGITSAITVPAGGIIAGTGSWFDLTGSLAQRPDPTKPTAMFGALGEDAVGSAGGSRAGIWLRLRRLVNDVRFFEKNRAAFDRRQTRNLTLPPADLAAMIPVLQGRIPLVMQIHRASDILDAIAWAHREGIRLVITGGTEAWKVAPRLAAQHVPVIFTPSYQSPGSFETLAARDDAATRLEQAGVPLVISSGGWTHNARRLRQEAGIAVAYGLSHEAALRSITSTPAAVFNAHANVGVIATGKRANLVLWSGDPLELSSVAERVWIDGTLQSLSTRQLELAKRYMKTN